ncbi:MAG: MFS transporter, partial [Oscillospiraceae bacterium]|nr:MFS transporter [Oscillospiraceae bacterium]
MEKTAQPRPFGLRDKIGYLFGDFGNDFTFILSTVILSKFYTDVMGVSAGVVGTVMMLARAVDAVTDLSMGRLCDRSRPTPVGKFKPWLLRLCVPVAAASFLLYQSGFAGRPMGFKIAYLAVTYILWGSFCYTGINIPYGSMASAISPEPADRQSLSTFRTMGGMLAGLIIGMLVPLLCYQAETLPSGGVKQVLVGSRVTLAAGVCSVLAIVCYLLCYALVTERVRPKATRRRLPFGALWRSALENRPLLAIIAASTLMLLAQLTMQNMSSYIYPDY